MPPLTWIVWPVIQAASSLARKTAAPAMSAGSPIRPAGIRSSRPACCCAPSASVMGERTKPGAMQFSVTPRAATSAAMLLVMPIMPALEAA